jgi:hypothetical protein
MPERRSQGLVVAPRRLLALSVALVLAQAATLAWAERPTGYGTVNRNAATTAELTLDLPPGKLHTATVCLDGHLFAVATVLGHGSAAAPSVAITQVYRATDGANRPADCGNTPHR